MTQQITKALRAAAQSIRADYRNSIKRYSRLDRKSRRGNGLDFEESEAHDFEDGFSSALHLALGHLVRELAAIGITL